MRLVTFILPLILLVSCSQAQPEQTIEPGAEKVSEYLKIIEGKKLGLVANHTSLVGTTHLLDTLLSLNQEVVRVFSPEHGFRGTADAGEHVRDGVDPISGLQVISLYGNDKKPKGKHLVDLDMIIFDLQDVGVRFYTYISTLHYVMEACAENDIPLLLLDRPNPNGFYVAGPVLDTNFRSFVGLHPVPLVYGMTIAEYAQMINGEGWLRNGIQCELEMIRCNHYTHDSLYALPVAPSPNLQTMQAVYLYPTLGLFEGTVMSVGRGTDFPFMVFGHPDYANCSFSFTPRSIHGAAKYPKHEGKKCCGEDLRMYNLEEFFQDPSIQLNWIIEARKNIRTEESFFNSFFYNVAGNRELKEQIIDGLNAEQIRKSWEKDVEKFKNLRKKYLLYP